MSGPNQSPRTPGLGGFILTDVESRSPAWRRFAAALDEELSVKRRQNDHPMNIQDTTVLRGEIALLKRILARTVEVGPGSRTSEAVGPESSTAPAAGGISLS